MRILGADAYKIDQAWRDARVISVLEFSVDGTPYAAMRAGKMYTLFNGDKVPMLRTSHVVADLVLRLAEVSSFSPADDGQERTDYRSAPKPDGFTVLH